MRVGTEETVDRSGQGRAEIANEIGRQLPYLRRFARAVTGQQALGDAAVRNALQALGTDLPRSDLGLRVFLYRALSRILDRTPTESHADNQRIAQNLDDAKLAVLRTDALLTSLEHGGSPRIAPQPSTVTRTSLEEHSHEHESTFL